jgi:transcription initiation factor TFIIIB Brf1 subunit/transcription initiation factor TFIIB
MCEHDNIIYDGEFVCKKCGKIGDIYVDETSECRNYEDKDDKSRVGFTISELLPNSSYGSIISFKGISSKNNELKSLQRLSTWSRNTDRSWLCIFENIQQICLRYNLPKCISMDACGMYKNLEDAQKVRGETRRALMGATLYISCRKNGASRTYEEISQMFNVQVRTLCKAVSRFIKIENSVLQTQKGIAERLCSSLNLNDTQRQKIMDKLYEISLKSEDEFENSPKTIVSGVVAYVLGLKTKNEMKQVSEISGVSVLSIHKLVGKI